MESIRCFSGVFAVVLLVALAGCGSDKPVERPAGTIQHVAAIESTLKPPVKKIQVYDIKE